MTIKTWWCRSSSPSSVTTVVTSWALTCKCFHNCNEAKHKNTKKKHQNTKRRRSDSHVPPVVVSLASLQHGTSAAVDRSEGLSPENINQINWEEEKFINISNLKRFSYVFQIYESPHSLRKQQLLGDASAAIASQRRRQWVPPGGQEGGHVGILWPPLKWWYGDCSHGVVGYGTWFFMIWYDNRLKQNPNNWLQALEGDGIVALVGASPVSKPYRVLDLQIWIVLNLNFT